MPPQGPGLLLQAAGVIPEKGLMARLPGGLPNGGLMGWTKHADAVRYYERGLGQAHNGLINAVESGRRTETQGKRIINALEIYFTCCCVGPGPDEGLCDAAVEILFEIFPELTFCFRR